MARICSSASSSNVLTLPPMPALLITMSTVPNGCAAGAPVPRRPAGGARLSVLATPQPPSAVTAATTSAAGLSSVGAPPIDTPGSFTSPRAPRPARSSQ